MGMFDSVMVPCPSCGTVTEFQSKGGDCTLSTYTLEDAPADVLSDVNRHSPVTCAKCNTAFSVATCVETRVTAKSVAHSSVEEGTHLRNLLARIHRDGGHYLAQHGLDKAVADADAIVARLHADADGR